MRAILIFFILVALAVFLSTRYPLDYSAVGMEQRITTLEARVDSLAFRVSVLEWKAESLGGQSERSGM